MDSLLFSVLSKLSESDIHANRKIHPATLSIPRIDVTMEKKERFQ